MIVMKIKNKRLKKWVIKQNLRFHDDKICLEANQLENKINKEKDCIKVHSLREKPKEFIKTI